MATHISRNGNHKIDKALSLLNEAAREKKEAIQESFGDKFSDFRETLGEIAEKNCEAMDRVKTAAIEAMQEGREKVEEKAKKVNQHVHKYPWGYIGGVAAGTLLLGWLVGRRNR